MGVILLKVANAVPAKQRMENFMSLLFYFSFSWTNGARVGIMCAAPSFINFFLPSFLWRALFNGPMTHFNLYREATKLTPYLQTTTGTLAITTKGHQFHYGRPSGKPFAFLQRVGPPRSHPHGPQAADAAAVITEPRQGWNMLVEHRSENQAQKYYVNSGWSPLMLDI